MSIRKGNHQETRSQQRNRRQRDDTVHAILAKHPKPGYDHIINGLVPRELIIPQCDGAEPCGACRSEKRKSRTCEYSEKAKGIAAARQESEMMKMFRRQSTSVDSEDSDYYHEHHPQDVPSHVSSPRHRAVYVSTSSWLMHQRISLGGVVNEVNQSTNRE